MKWHDGAVGAVGARVDEATGSTMTYEASSRLCLLESLLIVKGDKTHAV